MDSSQWAVKLQHTAPRARPCYRWMHLAWWVSIVLWLWAGAAWTQEPNVEDMLRQSGRKIETTKTDQENQKVTPPEATPVQLDVQWGIRRSADNEEALSGILETELKLARELGLVNQPHAALGLLNEGARAMKKGKHQIGAQRIQQARRLAPDLPAVEFAEVSYLLRRKPFAVFRIYDSLAQGYLKSWNFLPGRFGLIADGLIAALVALTIFGSVVFLVVILRHITLLGADLQRLLPQGVSRGQMVLLAMLVIVVPGVAMSSVLVSILVGLVLVGAYMSWSERIAAILLLSCLMFLPDAFAIGEAGTGFSHSPAARLASWGGFGCLDECRTQMEKMRVRKTKGEKLDPRYLQAMDFLEATARMRRGPEKDYSKIRTLYESLRNEPSLGPEMKFSVLNNLGVLLALMGNYPQAQTTLEQASRLDPTSFGPVINQSRLRELQGDWEGGRTFMQRAVQIGGNEAVPYSSASERVVSLWFSIESLPAEPLYQAHLAQTREPQVLLTLWRRGAGELPLSSVTYWALGALMGLLISIGVSRIGRTARRCPSCKQHMYIASDGPHGEMNGACRTCYNCFGGGKVDYHTQVRQEAIVERNQQINTWAFRIGNLLFPGLGSALRGSMSGIFVVLIGSLGWGLLLADFAPLPNAWNVGALAADGHLVIGGVLWMVALIVSLTLLYLGEPDDNHYGTANQ